MTTEQRSQLLYMAHDMANLVHATDDKDLTEIFDQLVIYISKLED